MRFGARVSGLATVRLRRFRGEEQPCFSWWVGSLLKFAATLLSLRLAIRYSIRGRAACQNWFRLPRYSLENMKKFRSQKEEKPPNLMKRKMK